MLAIIYYLITCKWFNANDFVNQKFTLRKRDSMIKETSDKCQKQFRVEHP